MTGLWAHKKKTPNSFVDESCFFLFAAGGKPLLWNFFVCNFRFGDSCQSAATALGGQLLENLLQLVIARWEEFHSIPSQTCFPIMPRSGLNVTPVYALFDQYESHFNCEWCSHQMTNCDYSSSCHPFWCSIERSPIAWRHAWSSNTGQ